MEKATTTTANKRASWFQAIYSIENGGEHRDDAPDFAAME
jgi:hypothetical protein